MNKHTILVAAALALVAAGLRVVGVVAAVALLLGADRLMDSMRVATNLLGNCLATFVIARWEGLLDTEKMKAVLDGTLVVDNPDELHARAVQLGATIVRGLTDEDYGSRGFTMRDPEGVHWSFGTY